MALVQDVLDSLEIIAPSRFAFDFDHIGLQIGDHKKPVERAAVALDRSFAAASFAVEQKCQLLLCHHPLIWEPMDSVTSNTYAGRTAMLLLRHEIAFIAAHTNWDCARGGINDSLAELLDLADVRACGSAAEMRWLKMVVFAPEKSAQSIIEAASAAGAGQIEGYRRCAFYHPGKGTFLGGEGTKPVVGAAGRIEEVEELRIEMVLAGGVRAGVEQAVRAVHPYETPAIDFVSLAPSPAMPICRIGRLKEPLPFENFLPQIDVRLNTRCLGWGEASHEVRSVCVCGGAADDEWRNAKTEGADVLVTGEVRQHVALEAAESGFCLVAAGHYATEHPGCVSLSKTLGDMLPDIEWIVFEPVPGLAGRPVTWVNHDR